MNKNQHLLRNWIHRKVYCQYFCVFVAKASIWLKWETGKYWLCRTLLKMKRERVSPCLVSWLRSWLTFWVSLNLDYTNTTIKPFLICTFKISRLKQENSKQESCIHLWQVNWVLFCFVFISSISPPNLLEAGSYLGLPRTQHIFIHMKVAESTWTIRCFLWGRLLSFYMVQ